jgi:hypothetical protein
MVAKTLSVSTLYILSQLVAAPFPYLAASAITDELKNNDLLVRRAKSLILESKAYHNGGTSFLFSDHAL